MSATKRIGPVLTAILTLAGIAAGLFFARHAGADQGLRSVAAAGAVSLLAISVLGAGLVFGGRGKWATVHLIMAALVCYAGINAVLRIRLDRQALPPSTHVDSPDPSGPLSLPAQSPADLATVGDRDFFQFLGPDRAAVVRSVELADDWERFPPRLVWRQPIGAGWSGFSVVNGHAVTMEQRGDEEAVTVYDLETGELVWMYSVPGRYQNPDWMQSGVGPRSTPTVHQGRVYSLGALGRLLCLDGATGALVWERDLLAEYGVELDEERRTVPFGRSASPLIVDDLVIVPAGGPEAGRRVSLVAYDKRTGALVWEGGTEMISQSSPTLATLHGVRQVLIVNEASVTGHDIATGAVLWRQEWPGDTTGNVSVSQPVAIPPDRLFLSKSYGVGSGLFELLPNGDGSFESRQIWQAYRVMRTQFTNVVVKDGYVFGLSDGILEAIELETGNRMWKGGRYGHGQILLVGDLLLVLAESGELFLVRATPERSNEVLGRIQALEGTTWNTFALYGPYLVARNAREAAVYELPLATVDAG